jgi:hypothetical protein
MRYLHNQQFNSVIFLINDETPEESLILQHERKIILYILNLKVNMVL